MTISPHVNALYYDVNHSNGVDYYNAERLQHENAAFRVFIENDKATFEMKEHHPTADSARGAVEPFLRNWELFAELTYGPDELQFQYSSADIMEIPPASGGRALRAESGLYVLAGCSAQMRISRSKYPPPPTTLERDSDVELMLVPYRMFRDRRRTLPDAAYFCLTVLERSAGSRKNAAKSYGIDVNVLDTVGRLTATKGGTEARKKDGAHMPLSGQERAWLEEAMKRLILRAAEFAHHQQSNQLQPMLRITMADLPTI